MKRKPLSGPSAQARVEAAVCKVERAPMPRLVSDPEEGYLPNPSLEVVAVEGKVAHPLSSCKGEESEVHGGFILVWKDGAGRVRVKPAEPQDLLALKVVVEGLLPLEFHRVHSAPLPLIDEALRGAREQGLVAAPAPGIRREYPPGVVVAGTARELTTAEVFSIQWHITQSCDLHCKHCYDRSARRSVSLEEGLALLRDLRRFCDSRFVAGHVVFTGGNPFLHPHFTELYRAAAELGFSTAILGNPVPAHRLEEILAIQEPEFYQISLEGLEEQTDYIRGPGHFRRSLEFLELLGSMGVTSSVMLTLTRRNREEVVPLARLLEGRTGGYTFNRLVPVGEGASLETVEPREFRALVEEFVELEPDSDCVYFKDNLINIALEAGGRPLFDGCTGFGCGAAFNFMAVLSDGTAHACRKFPSPLGNVLEEGMEAVYGSERARRYRRGTSACDGCRLRARCGGCMAVTWGMGLDPFRERDPYCFVDETGDRKGS